MAAQFHEDFSRDVHGAGGSDRSFGFIFAAVFAIAALLPLLHGHGVRAWAFGPAGAFMVLALAAPRVLAPLNRAWTAFGRLLNRVVSPVVMALLFVVAVVPTGLALRLLGRDPLKLKFDRAAATYWQPRAQEPPGTSFADQF